MPWKVGFEPVSSDLGHQSSRLRSEIKPDVWGHVLVKKNPDFRFNRMRKSGKTEFFEVHIERALIKHLITALFFAFRTFSAACMHKQLNIFITHLKYLF